MEEQFVPYELAVKLKYLGFDEHCLASYVQYYERKFDCERSGKTYTTDIGSPIKIYIGRYTNDFGRHEEKICKAPLWQQAFDWFRKEKGFDLLVKPMSFVGHTHYYDIHIHHSKYVWDTPPIVTSTTYEEARQACLEKLITLI